MNSSKNNNTNALDYIRACVTSFKAIATTKNKTKKILACIDTMDVFLQRLEATEKALVSGANDQGLKVGGYEIQRAIYSNVLEYWSDVLGE